VTITYVADPTASRELRIITFRINPPPQISGTLPVGRVNAFYTRDLTISGGTGTITGTVASGNLPPGISASVSSVFGFHLSGTPTAAGVYTFTLRVTDADNISGQATYTLSIGDPLQITTASLPAGTVGTRYLIALQGAGGITPYTWSLSLGALPPGLTLDNSGILTGVPTAAGTFNLGIQLDDAYSLAALDSAVKRFTLTIVAPLQITTTSLPAGAKGVPYQLQLQATGGTTPLQWSLLSGSLPAGLALSTTGLISGTPTVSGTFNITVKVLDANNLSDQKAYTLTIADAGNVGPFTSVHGATFQPSTDGAPEAIIAGFGSNLVTGSAATTSTSLPTSLLNISVSVKDSAGTETASPLFFVSPGQINYVVPAGLASGPATVSVRDRGTTVAAGSLQIQPVAPGFFTANADGVGTAAADVIRVAPDLSQRYSFTFECGQAPGSCVGTPIDLSSPTDSIYVLLFGTGIRGRTSLSTVTATVGGQTVPVVYAGPQSEYPGLDQVNLGPLPRTLAGRGTVTILVQVDGKAAPPVSVAIR
jgi:uncharacterized protein (TIGR03437 family)